MNATDDLVHLVSAGSNAEASVLRSFLENHDIQVYVQGENHRSLLGMAGAYIELNIMVPESQAEAARDLYREFEAAAVEEEEEEDDEADPNWRSEGDRKQARKKAMFAALVFPFGGAHFSIGAPLRGLLLGATGIAGIVHGLQAPAFFGLWAGAVAVDVLASRDVLRKQAK